MVSKDLARSIDCPIGRYNFMLILNIFIVYVHALAIAICQLQSFR
jgi:hypothetical protein